MKSSNIGGQAVLEGIMMKNGDRYAVGVRKPNQEIEVGVQEYKSIMPSEKIRKIPFIRGVFSFVDSLVLGMKTLTYSAEFFEEDAEMKMMTAEEIAKEKKKEQMLMNITMVLSVILAIGIFMVLPYLLSSFLKKIVTSRILLTVFEGIIRLAIFFAYILLISKMEDIQRTFMYHGAEHKCINCIEHGMELNVENVRRCSRQHKRCGTSFLVFVMIVSIIFCFMITADSQVMKILIRIMLMPIIAGVSFEIIRLAGSSNNPVINLLSKPGLMVQKMTTKEPDDGMIEVAIQAVEAVFDWRAYLNDNYGTNYKKAAETACEKNNYAIPAESDSNI